MNVEHAGELAERLLGCRHDAGEHRSSIRRPHAEPRHPQERMVSTVREAFEMLRGERADVN
jgi:hypothetical protein